MKKIIKISLSLLVLLLVLSLNINADSKEYSQKYNGKLYTNSNGRGGTWLLSVDGNVLAYDEEYGGLIKTTVDGGDINFIPLRMLSESLAMDVKWIAETETIEVFNGRKTLLFKIGSKNVIDKDSGKVVYTSELPSFIMPNINRTYIPARCFGETFGYKVDWKNKANEYRDELSSLDSIVIFRWGEHTPIVGPHKAATIYSLKKGEKFTDDGRSIYYIDNEAASSNPKDPNYSWGQDELVTKLQAKWMRIGENPYEPLTYCSGFMGDLSNNIWVDFGRKDYSATIIRWDNVENSKPILKETLELFLQEDKELAQIIYDDLADAWANDSYPKAWKKWVKLKDGIEYKIDFIQVNGKNTVNVKVKLDHFWH